MKSTKRAFGTEGEELALRFLQKTKKMKLVSRNFCIRGGEIDLILTDKRTLVFCEVKTRTPKSKDLGSTALAVDSRKQKHLIRAAKVFLGKNEHQLKFNECRFDVVEVYLPMDGTNKVYVRHTPYAFGTV